MYGLADVIHGLVIDFDALVIGKQMTKIDTIGDCYIVIAYINESEEDLVREEQARCLDMLEVAEGLLCALAKHRQLTGVVRFLSVIMIGGKSRLPLQLF